MELVNVLTGKVFTVPKFPSKTVEYKYPHDFFAEQEPKKPLIHIYGASKNFADVRNIVKKGILDRSLKSIHAITFLYMKLKSVKERLHSEWKSYNVLIGAANAEITPLSLLEVQEEQEGFPDGIQGIATANDDKWMCVYLCAIYRLINASSNAYRDVLINKIKKVLVEAGCRDQGVSLQPIFGYLSWGDDQNYQKIVAAIDMFFYRFPKNKWRILRSGTIGSRYRDCAALTSLHNLVKLTGLSKNDEVLEWVFTERIANDVERILTPGEELDNEYSYFPYQIDLGLTTRSPYSASANKCFYFFKNAVAVLLSDEKSKNAKMLLETDFLATVLNAQIMGYVFRKEDFEDIDTDAPHEKNAVDWLIFMKARNYKLTQKMKDFLERKSSSIVAPREGTIGAWGHLFI